jgi:hypothetical protein
MSDDVHRITLELRRPRGNDPGKVLIGHYMVVENAVVIADENGKPVGAEKHHLDPGGDARLIACRMLRRRQNASASSVSFSRPIQYPKIGEFCGRSSYRL